MRHLANLEEFIKVSYDVEENHTSVIKVVHQYLVDMKSNLEKTLKVDSGFVERLIDRVVGTQLKL